MMLTEKDAWECAARLLAADTTIRGLVGAHTTETTVQAVERYIAEHEEPDMDNPWEQWP